MIGFIIGLVVGGVVGMVATALFVANAEPCERRCSTEISCRRCRHGIDGRPDDRNENCALCITQGAWSGFENKK